MQYILKSKLIQNIHSEQKIQILNKGRPQPWIFMIHLAYFTLILALLGPVLILKFDVLLTVGMFELIFVSEASTSLTSTLLGPEPQKIGPLAAHMGTRYWDTVSLTS